MFFASNNKTGGHRPPLQWTVRNYDMLNPRHNPRALFTLTLLPERYAICRFDPNAAIPEWAAKCEFVSISRTPDELSLVCLESNVTAGVACEPGWRILKCEGPLDYSLPGIIASLAEPLAD